MRLICIVLLSAFVIPLEAQFTEVTHGFLLNGMPSGTTSGVSWYDYDLDGWDDLTIGQGNAEVLVFRNVQGLLQLQYAFPNTTQVKSFQWVDFDNDGDSDFFICAVNAGCKLWRNDGGLNFTDVSAGLNLPSSGEDSMGASWADYDRDGFLDVYVCNYFATNWLLHNNGDGTFTNVAPAMGVANSNRPTYMCSWVDYNNDCLLDLFVGNDLNQPSEMYENTGSGFQPVGLEIGLALTMEAMGICWSDYDNDLDLDVYITNVASGNKLLRNDNGIFTDVAAAAGAAVYALSWGCMWLDFNHDGLDDLHVGTQAPLVAQNVNFLLQQQTDGTFSNVSLLSDIGNCFASAKGDLNNDGYWDFADSFVLPASFKVWQNNGGDNKWVKLDLDASFGNGDGIGAKIYYWHGGQQHYTHTFCGESFFGQDSQYEILSLGSSSQVDSLRVEWPGGRIDTYYNLPSNQLHTLTEGSSSSSLVISASKPGLCSGDDEIILTVEGANSYSWSNGSMDASIVVTEPAIYWVNVVSGCNAFDSLSISIDQLPEVLVTEIATNPLCSGSDDGCIGVLLNGEEPSQITWLELGGVSPCAVLAGTYTYEASDSNGCVVSGQIILDNPSPIVVTSESVFVCGNETVAAQLSATGGTGSFTYSVMGADIGALSPGDYVGVATDENSCSASVNFAVQAYPAVNFTADADSICAGSVASLQYFGSGGVLPYTYDWQGQNPNALPAGEYEFTLTDGNGCIDVVSIEIAEYPALDAQISSYFNANGGSNGWMELTIAGGEPPYTILWSTGDTDEILDYIGQGSYSVTVTDANDCVSTDSQSIIDLDVTESQSSWFIYPNPISDVCCVVAPSGGNYVLRDTQGRFILAGNLRAGKTFVDLSNCPAGSYVLSMEAEMDIVTTRIVKL